MNKFNLTEDEITFIKEFIISLDGCNVDFENKSIQDLENIVSILEKFGVKTGKIYNMIISILNEKKKRERELLSDEIEDRLLKEKNKTEIKLNKF